MKKLFLMFAFALSGIIGVQAQNDTVLNVTQLLQEGGILEVCKNKYDRAIIYPAEGCNSFYWSIHGVSYYENQPLILNKNDNYYYYGGNFVWCGVNYIGCGINSSFQIRWYDTTVPNETTEEVWKHQHEAIMLEPLGADSLEMYDFLWNIGATSATIEVTEPGIYTCGISDLCATATRTFIVKDNVEIYRATVDLETNLNKTTWQVTEEQAEYISEVKVYRDGLLVGTAPYEQGYYLDAIGSDNAARNYRIVGVSVQGEDCPIESYEKGTIHTTYYQDVNSNLNMTWNIPYVEEGAQGTLTYFQICKYDPNTEELTVVDQVNASITDYTCGVNQFDGGYAVIAAVFNDGKGLEELSFSNLTTDILGLGENAETAFRIYPNPAKDCVTVEGTGLITITNALGQNILSKEIDGKTTMDLPQGMYFVELNGITRKIVVE